MRDKTILIGLFLIPILILMSSFDVTGTSEIARCQGKISAITNEKSKVSFEVKNIGKNEGKFTAKLTCDGISQSLYEPTQYVDAGDETTFNGDVSFRVNEDSTFTCIFKVTDQESGISKECEFGVDVEAIECEGDDKECSTDLSSLWYCEDNKWKEEVCEKGFYCDSKQLKCIGVPEYSKEEGTSLSPALVIGLIIIVIGLLLYLLFKKNRGDS